MKMRTKIILGATAAYLAIGVAFAVHAYAHDVKDDPFVIANQGVDPKLDETAAGENLDYGTAQVGGNFATIKNTVGDGKIGESEPLPGSPLVIVPEQAKAN